MLNEWEDRLSHAVKAGVASAGGKTGGALLHAIPSSGDWALFCDAVRSEWPRWTGILNLNPACLVVLYCGVAFYHYESGGFWHAFAQAAGVPSVPPRDQDRINKDFMHCLGHFELPLRSHANRGDYVGSAVHFTGVPLGVWGDFVSLCHWALWNPDWGDMADGRWGQFTEQHCGGRKRLKRFLVENRELAHSMLRKMLELRQRFAADLDLVDNLLDCGPIRREYLEEVPETAEFLCPQHPDRLGRRRAKLVFDRARREIYISLPGVSRAELPARWRVAEIEKDAGENPSKASLNSAAFKPWLTLSLAAAGKPEKSHRLAGAGPWAIFGMDDDGAMIARGRTELPSGRYVLLAPRPVDEVASKGLSGDDACPVNQQFHLMDGTCCYLTALEPENERGSASFRVGPGKPVELIFRPRERVECHLLPAHGDCLACFRWSNGVLCTQSLPTVCVSVPPEYFGDSDVVRAVTKRFTVELGGTCTQGYWRRFSVSGSKLSHLRWEWRDRDCPVIKTRPGATAYSFADISGLVDMPELRGRSEAIELRLESPELRREWRVRWEAESRAGRCWNDVGGEFLPMVLLSQCEPGRGMRWGEITLARNAAQPGTMMAKRSLYLYQDRGYLEQSGGRWRIVRSAAALARHGDELELAFCGDTGILWALYQQLAGETSALPPVEVAGSERGQPAYLRSVWPAPLVEDIRYILNQNGAALVDSKEALWNRL